MAKSRNAESVKLIPATVDFGSFVEAVASGVARALDARTVAGGRTHGVTAGILINLQLARREDPPDGGAPPPPPPNDGGSPPGGAPPPKDPPDPPPSPQFVEVLEAAAAAVLTAVDTHRRTTGSAISPAINITVGIIDQGALGRVVGV